MAKPERRTIDIERLHDVDAARRGNFKAIGDTCPVWINLIRRTEELQGDHWVIIKEKLIRYWRVDVPVGDSIMGVPVVQVDPDWVKREREILKGTSS